MNGNQFDAWVSAHHYSAYDLHREAGINRRTTAKLRRSGAAPVPTWIEALCYLIDLRDATASDQTLRAIIEAKIGANPLQ